VLSTAKTALYLAEPDGANGMLFITGARKVVE
jgi:hypothetical protein